VDCGTGEEGRIFDLVLLLLLLRGIALCFWGELVSGLEMEETDSLV
jgi:hypothetical protein